MIGDAGVVAAIVLGAGAVTTRRLHVEVELHGRSTRGMTVCDVRPFADPPDRAKSAPNVDVVVDVDVAALKGCFSSHVLLRPAEASGARAA